MNTVFPNPHPSLMQFVETIKKQSIEYATRLTNIRLGRENRPHRVPFRYPTVSQQFTDFCTNIMEVKIIQDT